VLGYQPQKLKIEIQKKVTKSLRPLVKIVVKASILFLGKDKVISKPPPNFVDLLIDMASFASVETDSYFAGFPHPKSASYVIHLLVGSKQQEREYNIENSEGQK
jgi:hypothetical protein